MSIKEEETPVSLASRNNHRKKDAITDAVKLNKQKVNFMSDSPIRGRDLREGYEIAVEIAGVAFRRVTTLMV
jgi:hypothetical protein